MVAVATSGSGKAGNLTIDAGYINLVGAIDDKGTLVGGIESSSRSNASTAIGGDLTVPGHGQRRLFAQSGNSGNCRPATHNTTNLPKGNELSKRRDTIAIARRILTLSDALVFSVESCAADVAIRQKSDPRLTGRVLA